MFYYVHVAHAGFGLEGPTERIRVFGRQGFQIETLRLTQVPFCEQAYSERLSSEV